MTDAETPARRRMSPEDRRELILDAARRLFVARGWEAVTVADVLAEAGISKGGFYHHFTAKEDLLDGLVARMNAEALTATRATLDATPGSALDRLNAFSTSLTRWKVERAPEVRFLADLMLRPGNDVVVERINARVTAAVRPLIADLIAAGVAEGLYSVTTPEITAELILALGLGRRELLRAAVRRADDGDIDGATAMLSDRLRAEAAITERLLGLAEGSLASEDPADLRRLIAAVARTPAPATTDLSQGPRP